MMILHKISHDRSFLSVLFLELCRAVLYLTAWRLQIDDDGYADIVSLYNRHVSWISPPSIDCLTIDSESGMDYDVHENKSG